MKLDMNIHLLTASVNAKYGNGYSGCTAGDFCISGANDCHSNATCTSQGSGHYTCTVSCIVDYIILFPCTFFPCTVTHMFTCLSLKVAENISGSNEIPMRKIRMKTIG